MSRIGKKPVEVPSGVKVEISGRKVKVSGTKGNLEMQVHPDINVRLDGSKIILENAFADSSRHKSLHGTMRALIKNMIVGVSRGFERKMLIYGTGYNVKEQGGKLIFQIGYCNPIQLQIPKSVKATITVPATKGNEVPAEFTLSGYNKEELGQFAATVRKIRPPEPYQGKGIRYADEHVIRKVGKAFAAGAA